MGSHGNCFFLGVRAHLFYPTLPTPPPKAPHLLPHRTHLMQLSSFLTALHFEAMDVALQLQNAPWSWWQLSHQKKNLVLSIESWLVNRDPYNGLWNNPYITGQYIIPFITQPTKVFFIAQLQKDWPKEVSERRYLPWTSWWFFTNPSEIICASQIGSFPLGSGWT